MHIIKLNWKSSHSHYLVINKWYFGVCVCALFLIKNLVSLPGVAYPLNEMVKPGFLNTKPTINHHIHQLLLPGSLSKESNGVLFMNFPALVSSTIFATWFSPPSQLSSLKSELNIITLTKLNTLKCFHSLCPQTNLKLNLSASLNPNSQCFVSTNNGSKFSIVV